MATRTASVSGLASATATWGGAAAPVNGDAIIINAGVVVDWDLDNSGFASGLIASTINGTMRVPLTPGAYVWKCAGAVTWGAAASYIADDGAGGLLPANVTFTQDITAAVSNAFNATTTIRLRCQEPVHKYVRLSGAAAISDTVLNVDTDITGEPLYWKAGDIVFIVNVTGAANVEQRTIASVSATQITLTAGLTAAKSSASRIVLSTRNIRVLGGTSAFNQAQNGIIAVERRGGANGFPNSASCVIGGSILGLTGSPIGGSGHTVSAPVHTTGTPAAGQAGNHYTIDSGLYGMSTALNGANNILVEGDVAGNTIVVGGGSNVTITNDGYGNGQVLGSGSGHVLRGANLEANLVDVATANFTAYDTVFGAVEYSGYTSASRLAWDYSKSVNHDAVAGAFRAWTRGGIVNGVATPVFDATRVRSYEHACESALFPAFWQEQALIPAGGSLYVKCYVRKTATMSYLPRLWIFTLDKEPLASGSPDREAIMTDSVDTWETLELVYTNSTDAPKSVMIRTLAKNATGIAYFDPVIRVSSFTIDYAMSGGLST